jgi:hypothetical protein
MGEGFIVRKGGVVSETTAAPTITIVTEAPDGVTFTLTNNDDNTAIVTYEIDDEIGGVELAAAATSSNITVALAAGTYTLAAYATVVGEVASTSDAAVEIVAIPAFELLYDSNVSATLPLTQIDITGLSIGKNDELRMVYTLIGDSSSETSFYDLQVNDITSNYHTQLLYGYDVTLSGVRYTNSRFALSRSNRKAAGFADIKVSNNDRFVAQSQLVYYIGSDSSGIEQPNYNVVNTGTVTSITKLSVVSSTTNGIAAGSRIRLYKVNTGDA